MRKLIICLILCLIFATPSMADTIFSQDEIRRLSTAKKLLMDTEKRSLDHLVNELSTTHSPRQQLAIYEAMAATFRDIIKKYEGDTPQSRERLLGKIRMNMAYFQLGGPDTDDPEDGALNRLIRRKLKHYLPEDIWKNPKLFHSLN